jgi:hypothetical protein
MPTKSIHWGFVFLPALSLLWCWLRKNTLPTKHLSENSPFLPFLATEGRFLFFGPDLDLGEYQFSIFRSRFYAHQNKKS